MLNGALLNEWLLWNAVKAKDTGWDIAGGSFVFNWYNLNGGKLRVMESNHDDVGAIDFDTYENPRYDGGGVLGKFYRKKQLR